MTKIQSMRKSKGFTQRQLAEITGVSIKTLREYEVGTRDINKAAVLTVFRLSIALNCRMEDLLELGAEELAVMDATFREVR